ncbi:NADH-quinone oxidoreductase subunit C [Aestuariimicrobium soli]|uniref:NADH-quinone oxidoreductase subunit C n=1 Tax=Aestuariimicrobium soli TaxID=2035834 RepID=UPI003EBDCF05
MAEPRTVPPEQWVEAVRAAVDEGFDWFDSLHAVDEIGRPAPDAAPGEEQLRVVVRVVRVTAEGRDALDLHTRVPREGGSLPTLAGVFPGASWHEREAHDFFGVSFADGDDRPLLWHQPAGVRAHRPLLKDSVLVARAVTPWPGAKDPEADGRAQASRRRTLPVGVPDAQVWGPEVRARGVQADPAEVAADVSGGRVRRRRG